MNCVSFILLFTSSFLSVNCDVTQIWRPSVLTEMLVNNTKTMSEHVQMQSNLFSNTITNYAEDAKLKKEAFTKDIEDLLKDTGTRLNKTLSQYLSSATNVGVQIKQSISGLESNAKSKYIPDMYLNTVEMIVKNGYNAESHTVKTEDGYLLTMHRIPHAKGAPTGSAGRQAVFLQHGLLSSSADFITSGPKKGLAYILAEAGYDVWLGNFRGNTYSRAHTTFSIKDAVFWNFTWHEIAIYDLPAMIDYVNEIKKTDKEMIYIGHSMGNTALYVLLSTKPEYNNKLKAAFSMAPVAFMTALLSPLRLLAPYADSIEWIAQYLGADEFLPQSSIVKWLALGCESNHYEEKICQNVLFLLSGYDEKQFDKNIMPIVMSHTPAGASTKTIIHFAQEIRDKGRFQQFDHGPKKNLIYYGQEIPPEYSISLITLPITLLSADNDWLAGVPDSRRLFNELGNPVELYEIPFKEFNHFDFMWAIDAPTLVYKKLLDSMQKYKIDNGIHWSFPFLQFDWKQSNHS